LASGVAQWTGTFELTGKSGRGDYLTRLDISGLQPDESNRAIFRYLWARTRIAELSDYGFRQLCVMMRVKEITSLGLQIQPVNSNTPRSSPFAKL
jgi:hypothetical protein